MYLNNCPGGTCIEVLMTIKKVLAFFISGRFIRMGAHALLTLASSKYFDRKIMLIVCVMDDIF